MTTAADGSSRGRASKSSEGNMYTLVNPRTGERAPCNNLGELINAWIAAPHCAMTAVGVPESEQRAIENVYALRDQLQQARRTRSIFAAAAMRRFYSSEEGVVL